MREALAAHGRRDLSGRRKGRVVLLGRFAKRRSNLERRLNYRLALIARVTLPLLILAVGAAVMMFVVGYFLPLVELIAGSARPGGK